MSDNDRPSDLPGGIPQPPVPPTGSFSPPPPPPPLSAAPQPAPNRGPLIAAAVVVALVLAGGGYAFGRSAGSKSPGPSASTSAYGSETDASATPAAEAPSPTAPAGHAATCAYTHSGDSARHLTGLPPARGASRDVAVTLRTTQGSIGLELLGDRAPCTVRSFLFLVGQGYYNGTPCHRLTTSGIFVLQCGDPTGTGAGGPGYRYADENLAGATYPRGTLAMANAGAGTNGSQFFLVYKDTQLPPSYTPFGRITSGLDVLAKVAAAGSDPVGDGAPKLAVTITSVE